MGDQGPHQVIGAPFVAEDGSVAPSLSRIFDPTTFKFGGVWQAKNGFFVHVGGNYSPGTQGRVVAGTESSHSPWGLDLRIGIHPGVTPPRQRVRRIKETTTVTNTVTVVSRPRRRRPPWSNRPPTVRITCDPSLRRARTDVAVLSTGNGSGRRTADLSLDGGRGKRQPDGRAEHDVHGAADGRSGQRDRDGDRQREERRHRVGDAARAAARR